MSGGVEPGMGERWYRYTGSSMLGTFLPGELLRVLPLRGRPAVGEVVVFTSRSGQALVHRVVGIREDGSLQTAGDSSAQPDSEPVPLADVVGRVVSVGGRDGERAFGGTSHRPRRGPRLGRAALGPLYRWLSGKPAARRLFRLLLRPRLHYLRYANRRIVQVVHRGRVVAWLYPETRRIRCRAPYALVVEPAAEPLPETAAVITV